MSINWTAFCWRWLSSVCRVVSRNPCCFLALVLIPVLVHAEAAEITPETIPALSESPASPVGPALEPLSPLRHKFYRALNSLIAGDYGVAGENFEELNKLSTAEGYSGLPDYSIELFNQANQVDKTQAEVRFLVNSAVSLSPSDSRVNLIAASFYPAIGFDKASSYLWQSLAVLPEHPLQLVALVINLLFVGLIASVLALFVICVVQLLRSGSEIFNWIVHRAPSSAKGITSALFLAGLMILPLFGGILSCILVWGLILTIVKPGCKWLAALTGALILSWGLAIPVVDTIGRNVDREAFQVIESINNLNFTPKGEQFVQQQLKITPDDPLMLFALGELYQVKNRLVEAKEVYQRIVGGNRDKGELYAATMLNIGVIEYRKGNFKKAVEIFSGLEDRGQRSVALFYNLALTHLALLDTNKHRSYYELAKDYSSSRLLQVELLGGEKPQPLMASVPRKFYYPLLTKSYAESDTLALSNLTRRREELAGSLISWGGSHDLLLLGAAALLVGIGLGLRKRKAVEIVNRPKRTSFVWNVFPAGGLLARERPVPGVFALMAFLMLILLGLESPINFYNSLPVDISFQPFFFGAAFTVFTLSALAALLTDRLAEANV